MPGLAGDHAAISNGLLVDKCSSSLFGFEADVLIAGNAFAFREAGGGEHLDAMTDGEDPLLLRLKFADDTNQSPVIAEILGSAAAQNKDGIITPYVHLVEREVGLQTVAGTLDVGVPPWLKVVHDEMESTNRRSCNGGAPVFLAKPMNRVKRFVGFACIAGND